MMPVTGPRRHRRARQDAHQADRAAAIDQPRARLGDRPAERLGGAGIVRPRARIGAAIDADASQFGHKLVLHRDMSPVKLG